MNRKRSLFAVFLTFVLVSMTVVTIIVSQTRMDKPETDSEKIKKIRATYPITLYSTEMTPNISRKTISQKYDSVSVLSPNPIANTTVTTVFDWEQGLPAIPVNQSQIIVMGTIVEAKAFLSNNKNSVYSEFTIEIDKIFKNEHGPSVKGSHITAERFGGIVRFQNELEAWSFVEGQGMPIVSHRYLFFLTEYFPMLGRQKGDLHILTAYGFEKGVVVPLDSPSGGTHPIAKAFKGKPEAYLLDELNRRLSNVEETPKLEERR